MLEIKNTQMNNLNRYLKIEKGDVYNGAVLKERVKGDGTPTSQDIIYIVPR